MELKFATGTWVYGKVGDRYLLEGYRQGLDVLAAIELISDIDGVEGVEMIYPADFSHGVDEVGEALAGRGLDCAAVGADLAGDPVWKFGSFSSKDPAVREKAVELTRRTVDAALALGAERINVWPGEDGHDYPFQVDYSRSWEWFAAGLAEAAAYRPDVEVCLEYKLREPRVRSLVSTVDRAVLMCRDTGAENVGVTIDIGHSMQAGESVAESIATLAREGRLFHVHLNDNYRGWDDDLALGSVHLVEFLEALFHLEKSGYKGWLSVDVYPYREDPSAVVEESVGFLVGLEGLLDRVGRKAIESHLEDDDPLPLLAAIRRELLGG